MPTVVDLPSPSESSDLTYIIVKESSQLAMGVDPVKPGGHVSFMDVTEVLSLVITFQNGSSPFTTGTSLTTNNQLQIDNASDGDYYFGFTAANSNDQTYPYRIAVDSSGAGEAEYHMLDDSGTTTLNVFQKQVRDSSQTEIRVEFSKEGFSDAVYLEVTGDADALYRVPQNQSVGVWVIRFSTGLTESLNYTINATLMDPSKQVGGQIEVIGSSAADLEIEPPP